MHAAVAEVIVVMTRFIVIMAFVVTGAVHFMAVFMGANRRSAGGFRNTLETGKHDSAKDSNADGSGHRSRYSGNFPDLSSS